MANACAGGAVTKAMQRTIKEILSRRQMQAVFQPIVEMGRHLIIGYEALIRGPSDSPLHNPITLFEMALRQNLLVEAEQVARVISIESCSRLGLEGWLFINTSPLTLLQSAHMNGETLRVLERNRIAPERVVMEISEQLPVGDYSLMRDALEHYRGQGFRVAIDDLGAGYSSLRGWAELRPEFVKIDRHFISGCDRDPVKRQFLESLQAIADSIGCKLVAEGIETEGEHAAIGDIGIHYGQGYWFARPSADPPRRLESRIPAVAATAPVSVRLTTETVRGITRSAPWLSPERTAAQLAERFQSEPELQAIAVVHRERPLGLVSRNHFLLQYHRPYGRELFGRHPVTRFLDPNILSVEAAEPLDAVSRKLTGTLEQTLHELFLVTEQGRYLGIGSSLDLLRRITELQLRAARYANPLTQLPGNVPIEEQIDTLLAAGSGFVLCYVDIDNFKPYNDYYSYVRGDEMIRVLARCLNESCPVEGFVGHIGGDDFILILPLADGWRAICEKVLERFAEFLPQLYDAVDFERGHIEAENRQGEMVRHPLASLSIGAVEVPPACTLGRLDLAALAGEAKVQAKRRRGNSLFVQRRRLHRGQAPSDLQ